MAKMDDNVVIEEVKKVVAASDKVRIGIIGCGGIANGKHMPNLAKIPEVAMVAFCDIIEERAVKAKNQFGTPDAKVYTDYRKLLEDKSIDVVHVLTPNRWHSPITVDALNAGKHVMCEKPMAINSVEAKKMIDAANLSGKKLTIGYQNRQLPASIYLKRLADEGVFGDIYYVRAHALRRRGVPTWGVFLDEYAQGGGPLIDIATHSLDRALWIINNYKPKYCIGTTYHKLNGDTNQGNRWGKWDPAKFTVEDSAFGFVVMENGCTVSVESSWALNFVVDQDISTVICGTKAGADTYTGLRLNYIRDDHPVIETPDLSADNSNINLLDMQQWIRAIVQDKTPTVLPEQAYVVTQILEGIYTSAKTGTIYNF